MKKVLCYGDSNTYGYMPETGARYDKSVRWAGILAGLCKGEFEIIEAGANNRKAFMEQNELVKYLDDSFDVLILAIGINDIQKIYQTKKEDIYLGIKNLIKDAKTICPKIKIILVSPARLKSVVLEHPLFSMLFDEKSVVKSFWYSEIYKQISQEEECIFMDWAQMVEASDIDGLHFSVEAHGIIANKFFEILQAKSLE